MEGDQRNDAHDGGKDHASKERDSKETHQSTLSRACDRLEINTRLSVNKQHYYSYRRYVCLNKQSLFDNLVGLYEELFKSEWGRFKRFIDTFPQEPDVSKFHYAAVVYISTWFHDTYVTIRDSVRKLSSIAANEHYQHDRTLHLRQYDAFLVMLNAHIRPTLIAGTPEETMWIPFIHNINEWVNNNPFEIVGYNCDYAVARGIVSLMIDGKRWKVEELSSSSTGRPSWLFDWHVSKAYAWFRREGNYTDEDVAIAYIIGGPCTPNLGPRDVDDWQTWPNNVEPANYDALALARVDPPRWGAGFLVRTIINREMDFVVKGDVPATPQFVKRSKKRRAETAPSDATPSSVEQGEIRDKRQVDSNADTYTVMVLNQFQICDWTYHCEVIVKPDATTRTEAHLSLIVSD